LIAPFDPAGRFILVPGKRLDGVFLFRLDGASRKLTPNDPPFAGARERAGPRHIAFHPTMPRAYVIDELDSTMATLRYDPARGARRIPTRWGSFASGEIYGVTGRSLLLFVLQPARAVSFSADGTLMPLR
jgi:hypothetical protein